MWVAIGNIQCKVTRATDEEKSWLVSYLSFEDSKARFQRGRTDDRVRMFNLVSSSFATGFLPMVKKAAADAGFEVETADHRTPPCAPDHAADLQWLRDYQIEGVRRSVDKERGILWCPTGSGKTEIAVGLAMRIPCRWLFLVHRATLMDQAATRFEKRTGLKAGRIGEGMWDLERFTCATFQTLHARMGTPEGAAVLGEAEGIMIDEAHTLPADSFWRVVMKATNAYYRIGLSGTPLARGDKRSILTIAATGPVIYRIKPETLIDAGVLARPKIRLVPVVQASQCPTWQGVYGECIVRSPKRNAAMVEMAQRAAKPCLVFVKEIAHGKRIRDQLIKAGIRTEFTWGSDANERRMASVKRLERGDIDVLVCSVIFQEGVDIPQLRSVVIGSGGKSVIAAIQRVGRGMRKVEGKEEFEVWDIADRGNKWLDRHTRQRLKAYAGEGYETVVDEDFGVTIAKKVLGSSATARVSHNA